MPIFHVTKLQPFLVSTQFFSFDCYTFIGFQFAKRTFFSYLCRMKHYYFLLTFLSLPLWGLISCKTEGGKAKPTTKNIDTLITLYPDSLPILLRHGQYYYEKLRFDKALPSATKAFRLDSNRIDVRLLYAEILNNRPERSLEDVLSAQRHYDYILKKEPKNTKALVGLASTFTLMQDFDRSFQYINEALRIDPKYRDAYILKGTNYLQLNNMKLAKSSYETATQQDPEFYQAYIALGDLYNSEENEICIQYYTTAAQLQPDDIGVLYKLAYAYQTYNKLEEALEQYRVMYQKDPEFAMSLFQQGYIKHIYQNEIDSAIIYYQQALVVEPKFVEAWHNIGMCYEAKNNVSKALQSYSKALKYNPKFEKSREAADKLR